MLSGSFNDLFAEEIQRAGRALAATGLFCYLASKVQESGFFQNSDVQYAIEAHLPQVFDRSIVTARSGQRLTKSLLMDSTQIQLVKNRLRDAPGREMKVNCMTELFPLSVAAIISAAHVHSATVTLYVVQHLSLVLVHVLRKLEAARRSRGSRGGAVVRQLRSWWSGGVRSLVLESLAARLHGPDGLAALFASSPILGEEIGAAADPALCFSVDARLRAAVPRVAEAARRCVGEALRRRPPQAFAATASATSSDLRELFADACAAFEAKAQWGEWLRTLSDAAAGGGGGKGSSSESVSEFSGGSAPVSPVAGKLGGRYPHYEAFDSAFGPARDQTEDERVAQAEERQCEELARGQAVEFFHEIIRSASFGELCTAYATEVLEKTLREVSDLRTLGTYDSKTDSAKMPHVITLVEKCRMNVFDRDFVVPPYVRIFCEETIRATCRDA